MIDNNSIIPNFDAEWDKSLRITLSKDSKYPDILQVYLIGTIDNYNANFFEIKLSKILENGPYKILFKCASLDYVSSVALGIFNNFYPKFKALGGTFVFIDLPQRVLEIFQLLGFNHFFNIVSNISEAFTFFNSTEKAVPVFPCTITCPMCSTKLKTSKSGMFKCPKCKSILTVSQSGKVSL